jgi:hypothetical protein
MKRAGIGLLWAIGGYVIAAFVSYLLLDSFSPNTHDRALEATMSSIFVWGPLGGIIAFFVGLVRAGRKVHK